MDFFILLGTWILIGYLYMRKYGIQKAFAIQLMIASKFHVTATTTEILCVLFWPISGPICLGMTYWAKIRLDRRNKNS